MTTSDPLQPQKMDNLGQLTEGIVRDFNKLMLAVLGTAEFAAASTVDPEMLELLAEITRAARRAADLTRQLSNLSRQRTICVESVNVNNCAAGLMKMLRRLIPENIGLEFVPTADLAGVRIDPGQLEQVIFNLCLDARDASTAGGTINVQTRTLTVDVAHRNQHPGAPLGDWVLLTVQDRGCGISRAVRQQVFEPFLTTNPVGASTGLGLATVYAIVEQYGGIVHVKSKPGAGFKFEVYLPVYKGAPFPRDRCCEWT